MLKVVDEKDIRPIRVIDEYGDLIDALVSARHRSGLTQNEVDDLSGLQDGYVGKIENWTHEKSGRGLGVVSLPSLLGVYGMKLCLVRIDESRPRQEKPCDEQYSLDLCGGGMAPKPSKETAVKRNNEFNKRYGRKRAPGKKIKKLVFETGRP